MKTTKAYLYNPAQEGIDAARADARAAREGRQGQHTAGHVNYADDGDTAYVWTRTAWCASMTVTRGDMSEAAFKAMVDQIAVLAKAAGL